MEHQRGFTLIELLIVMTVIIILAGILIPSFRGFQNEAWNVKAEQEVGVIQTAIESYFRNHKNNYPPKLEDLLTTSPKLLNQLPQDPFKSNGNTYGYEIVFKEPGKEMFYVIYSPGPNRIKNWTWDSAKGSMPPLNDDDILVTNAPIE